jgi:mannitol/fructose-specific phosphotransferase system IIA component (Ntr-type)/predicted transcriptional regulator
MIASKYLNRNLIVLSDPSVSKSQAIDRLIELIARNDPSLDDSVLRRVIYERESVASTTFPNGFAIPHARITNYQGITIAVLVPRNAIHDNELAVKLVVLIVTDLEKPAEYLHLLSSIISLGSQKERLDKLLSAKTPESFIELASAPLVTESEKLSVSDFMNPLWVNMTEDSTLREAVEYIISHQIPYIPICDSKRRLIGEVTILDILSAGLPHYTQSMPSLTFLSSLEPLENLVKNENSIRLASIMKKPVIMLSPETPVIEVIFQFTKNSTHSFLPVVRDGFYLGTVSHLDIINKFF